MNKKLKLILVVVVLFFAINIFNTNSVFGVGIVGQIWHTDTNNDGKFELVFRTYTTPYITTVQNYYNKIVNDSSLDTVENGSWWLNYGNKPVSRWVDVGNEYNKPSEGTFTTIAMLFHKDTLSTYDNVGKVGYNWADKNQVINSQFSTIVQRMGESIAVNKISPQYKDNYDSSVFYKIDGVWGTVSSTDGLFTWGGNVQKIEYRYSIVNIGGNNVYVGDRIVEENNLKPLINTIRENEIGNEFYVSDVVVSKSFRDSSRYEYANNPQTFFSQYKKGYGYYSARTEGRTGRL